MTTYRVTFPDNPDYDPVELAEDTPLSEAFDASNSPVLFGCRTGICGTCLVEITPDAPLPAPEEYEQEVLDIYAEDNPKARLCCQVRLRANCAISILHPS